MDDEREIFHLHAIADEETTQVDTEVATLTREELVRYYTQHTYIILYQRPRDVTPFDN